MNVSMCIYANMFRAQINKNAIYNYHNTQKS